MADYSNREELEAWLNTQPREIAVLIAARAALRIAPTFARAVASTGPARRSDAARILAAFRTLAATWAGGLWPEFGMELQQAAAFAIQSRQVKVKIFAAAVFAASAFAFNTPILYTLDASLEEAFDAAGKFKRGAEAAKDIDAALLADVVMSNEIERLNSAPLWPNHETPGWALNYWKKLKKNLLDLDQTWEVWTEWYEDRLYGGPTDEFLEIARVLIPNDVWGQDSSVVNAEIKRLIDGRSASGNLSVGATVSGTAAVSRAITRPWRAMRDDEGRLTLRPSSAELANPNSGELQAAIEQFERASEEAHRAIRFLNSVQAGLGHNSIPAGQFEEALPIAVLADLNIADIEVHKPVLEPDRLVDLRNRLQATGEELESALVEVDEEKGELSTKLSKLGDMALDEFAKAYGKRLGDLSAYVTWAVVAAGLMAVATAIGAILANLPT